MWKHLKLRHARQFAQHVVPAVVKPARILWNEIIGFFFLVFGVVFGFKTARYAMDLSKGGVESEGSLFRTVIAGFCTLVMLGYGLSSFLRARKIAKS